MLLANLPSGCIGRTQGGTHGDIVSDIMNHKVVGRTPTIKAVRKARRELEGLLRNPASATSDLLQTYAAKLGRKKKDRGKEPTWVREDNPKFTFPLSIPDHSEPLKKRTARSIIDSLLSDCDQWLQELDEEEDGENNED